MYFLWLNDTGKVIKSECNLGKGLFQKDRRRTYSGNYSMKNLSFFQK
ncbi:hypothetical protein ELI_2303 [Eubacterium callanderi]|uniref:Uncharacterized protein n=1 Tax=Eubacterium callanderi TaxID=53442 RepID=E3GNP3_9FIRM|nr:hypothetical protein ELI_2303 [Eubacterium callanderi]